VRTRFQLVVPTAVAAEKQILWAYLELIDGFQSLLRRGLRTGRWNRDL
jgi:hypothetical protein